MDGATLIEPIAANVEIYQEVADRYFAVRDSLKEPLLARQGLRPLKSLKHRPVTKALRLVREIPPEVR